MHARRAAGGRARPRAPPRLLLAYSLAQPSPLNSSRSTCGVVALLSTPCTLLTGEGDVGLLPIGAGYVQPVLAWLL
eukprot:COSAG02_NODE_8817_length_2433_cov_1.489717_2_plen_76_part_00